MASHDRLGPRPSRGGSIGRWGRTMVSADPDVAGIDDTARATAALKLAIAAIGVTIVIGIAAAFAVPFWLLPIPGLALATAAIVTGRRALASLPAEPARPRSRARTAIVVASVFIGYVAVQLVGLLVLASTGRL